MVDVDGVDILGCGHRWHVKPILSPMYRYLGRYINTTGIDNWQFESVLIIDGTSVNIIVIIPMSMSQPSTPMATSRDDDDTIDNISMVDPWP
jgi:hypothetical protein